VLSQGNRASYHVFPGGYSTGPACTPCSPSAAEVRDLDEISMHCVAIMDAHCKRAKKTLQQNKMRDDDRDNRRWACSVVLFDSLAMLEGGRPC
jgi:hypothetical protein